MMSTRQEGENGPAPNKNVLLLLHQRNRTTYKGITEGSVIRIIGRSTILQSSKVVEGETRKMVECSGEGLAYPCFASSSMEEVLCAVLWPALAPFPVHNQERRPERTSDGMKEVKAKECET